MKQQDQHSLLGFSIRNQIISHDVFEAGFARIEVHHQRARASGFPHGLLITGLSGSGKSTLRDEYLSRYPRSDEGTVSHIPILSVDTPAAPTVKNLAETILIALGDSASHKGSAEDKTQRIYHFLRLCKVELLLIDEFQHFAEHGRRSEMARVSDWLKSLINRSGVSVVLFGLPSCELALQCNIQLARRFSARYNLMRFSIETDAGMLKFRALLKAIEGILPLPSVALSTMEMATRFYFGSFGLIDYVGKIVDGAVQAAARNRSSCIDMQDYGQAFVEEVWRDCPPNLNPFLGNDKLRPLIRAGEPFAMASGAEAYNRRISKKNHEEASLSTTA
ncbi:MAG: TniB family NTP-binding protein [Desulforhabdus sp.]|jgi:hypothetical protein|nr:TniB family NTP-binding protein [Desulforhabdus sp.]